MMLFHRLSSTLRSANARTGSAAAVGATAVVGVSYAAAPFVLVTPSPARPGSEMESKAHHNKDGKGFVNPWESFVGGGMTPSGIYNMWRDWESRPVPPAERLPPLCRPEFDPPPSVQSSPRELAAWHADLKATWLGHACFLVEFPTATSTSESGANEGPGVRVLFDPVWSHRCSPSQLIGPARVVDPPIKIDEIPPVSAVVISHNHYDHLDIMTLKHLYDAQPRGTLHFFAPLGNRDWFIKTIGCDPSHVSEMDWWDSKDVELSVTGPATQSLPGKGFKVTCTPCQHFTGRGILDRNDTLWASWSVESNEGGKVWFAGDTGYKSIPRGVPIEDEHKYPHCPAFKQIGDRLGGFDLGMIPIGAYDPRWFMSRVHCSPEDSVELHRETKCRHSLGMHHSTWMLTCEPMDEPPVRLRKACDKYGISDREFGVSGLGETRRFKVERGA